ncbi:MAG: hypothetical protein IIC87_07530 [Chloroflexi bacterium]|nr:hypothetical protein [Chloroflexota bacterium]
MSNSAAIILCERVLADLAEEHGSAWVDRFHEAARFERAALQTYAVRISLACLSGDADDTYIPCERWNYITFGESLAQLAADKWGREAGLAIIDAVNGLRLGARLSAGFGLPEPRAEPV